MKLHSLFLAAVLMGASLPACETFGSTKVARGQLYVSGDGRWDPFFDQVHQQQIEAASWGDDRKAARKPVTTAISVPPNASESTILDELKNRSKTRADADKLSGAIEETRRADADRADKLRAAADKLEALAKDGQSMVDAARQEYENRGAMKADPDKSEKMRQVRRELEAAVEACNELAKDARKSARAADWFADDMQRALEGKPRAEHSDKEEPPRRAERPKDEDKKPDAKADEKKPDGKKPSDKAAPKPEAAKPKPAAAPAPAKPAPPPADKPAEKKQDEVFNP